MENEKGKANEFQKIIIIKAIVAYVYSLNL